MNWEYERSGFVTQMNRSLSPDPGHISPALPIDEVQQDKPVIMAMESDEEDEDNQTYVRLSACTIFLYGHHAPTRTPIWTFYVLGVCTPFLGLCHLVEALLAVCFSVDLYPRVDCFLSWMQHLRRGLWAYVMSFPWGGSHCGTRVLSNDHRNNF